MQIFWSCIDNYIEINLKKVTQYIEFVRLFLIAFNIWYLHNKREVEIKINKIVIGLIGYKSLFWSITLKIKEKLVALRKKDEYEKVLLYPLLMNNVCALM